MSITSHIIPQMSMLGILNLPSRILGAIFAGGGVTEDVGVFAFVFVGSFFLVEQWPCLITAVAVSLTGKVLELAISSTSDLVAALLIGISSTAVLMAAFLVGFSFTSALIAVLLTGFVSSAALMAAPLTGNSSATALMAALLIGFSSSAVLMAALLIGNPSVSYTHLRAHET